MQNIVLDYSLIEWLDNEFLALGLKCLFYFEGYMMYLSYLHDTLCDVILLHSERNFKKFK